MKQAIFVLALIFGSNCSAQEPVAAIESPEFPVLYRGYENKVVPAVTNNDGRVVQLSGEGVKIEAVENGFIVKPGSSKRVTLHVLLSDGVTADTIRSIEYRVGNLPVADVYWGEMKNGGIANIRSTDLSIKYSVWVPFENDHRILAWEVKIGEKTISGNGSSLTPAEAFLKNVPSGTILIFAIKTLSPDGITRLRSAQWQVNSWQDEINANPLDFDRD